MRLFLLPISTRRTLIYCEPLANTVPQDKQTYLDRIVNKANTTWATWEKDPSSIGDWKRKTTKAGNMMFRRIPFEEWGLKSIPPLRSSKSKIIREEGQGTPVSGSKPSREERIEVNFPRLYHSLCKEPVMDMMARLSTERQSLHRKRMWWSLVGLPISAPIGLLPIVPNIPFFYLAFRAYSHWKASEGSKHLEHLLKTFMIHSRPSATLDSLYTAGLLNPTRDASRDAPEPTLEQAKAVVNVLRGQHFADSSSHDPQQSKSTPGANNQSEKKPTKSAQADEEIMLLRGWNGKLIAERLKLPGLEVEIERAVEQVEKSVGKSPEDMDSERMALEALARRAQVLPPAAVSK